MQDNENTPTSFDNEPAKIVQIAYRQMSEMSGLEDPCFKSTDSSVAVMRSSSFNATQRLFQMSIFESLKSSMSTVYNQVKNSNEIVSSIFTTTEEGLEQGAKLVEPVTQKLGSTLETPLKCVDNVLCQGLDYLEETVPSIISTSGLFMTNLGNAFKTFTSTLTQFYLNAVKNVKKLSVNEDDVNGARENTDAQKN